MDRQHLDAISLAGISAPSADNRLAFWFSYEAEATDLWSEEQAFAAASPRHRQVLDLLGFGAIVENMLLQAQSLGYDGRVRWFPRGAGTNPVAHIDWLPRTTRGSDDLVHSIPGRQTNRHFYFGKGPSDSQQASLSAEVARVDGARVCWLEGDKRRKAHRLIWLAESERFLRRSLHQELFDAIRFDLDWRESAEQGLPPSVLEVERPMRPMFKAMRHWPLMRALNLVGAHRMLGLRAGLFPCMQAPALGVLCTSLDWQPGAIAAGRGLERLWLRATSEKLVMQPMAASTVLAFQSDADDGISAAARATLLRGWKDIVGDDTAMIVFRMGRADGAATPSNKTRRPGLAAHLRPA